VLRWFVRAGYLDASDALDIAGWEHGSGFSLNASVRIEAPDRAGLERLLRYFARPPFALDRLQQLRADQVVYRLPNPRLDGCTALRLTPLELIDRLAALIPPPRLHRHRYHAVLAPNSPYRAQVRARGRAAKPPAPPRPAAQASAADPSRAPYPHASPGLSCWPACMKTCPCSARSAPATCASSPSSPSRRRSRPS
jgi:hypothetical protein